MHNEEIRILLVDDDAETRDVYVHYFQTQGYQIDEAENGAVGLERVKGALPSIIISGIVMPKMDGFSFAQALRRSPETANIPIIFLSHLGRQEDEAQLKALGIDDFIVRDITPLRDIEERVRALVSAETQEYILAVELESFDAKRLAHAIGLPEESASLNETNSHYILRLRKLEGDEPRFDAKIISA